LKFFYVDCGKTLFARRLWERLWPGGHVAVGDKRHDVSRKSEDKAGKLLSGGHKIPFGIYVFPERQVIKLFSRLENI